MVIVEYLVIQALLIIWFVYIIRNYPKKDSAYSYKVFVGNIGAIILMTAMAVWLVANNESFLGTLWQSITK